MFLAFNVTQTVGISGWNGKYGSLAKVGDPLSIKQAILDEILVKREIASFIEATSNYSIEKITSDYIYFLSR